MGLYEDDGEFIDDLIAFDTANKYEKSRNSGKKNGCYIATCVYGSYDCPGGMDTSQIQRRCIKASFMGTDVCESILLYQSQTCKKYGSANWFRRIWRRFLDFMVDKLHEKGIEDTKYTDLD